MSTSDAPELLVCDTSFVGLVAQRHRKPQRVAHWDAEVLRRIEHARNAISVFTVAEARAGYLMAQFTRERIEQEERRLQRSACCPSMTTCSPSGFGYGPPRPIERSRTTISGSPRRQRHTEHRW